MAAETSVVRTYIECLLSLPWGVYTEDNLDINHAEDILNADHFGLDKVKERILEYLSIRKLTDSIKGANFMLSWTTGGRENFFSTINS